MSTKIKQVKIEVENSEDYGLKNVYDRAINSKGNEVYVGQHFTESGYTDRTPYTVIGVSKSGAKVLVQQDDADYTDFDPMDGYANPKRKLDGRIKVVNASTKTSHYKEKGSSNTFVINYWEFYRDPSF